LTTAASGLLASHDDQGGSPRPWWTLPPDAGYLWRHLSHHLAHAGAHDELAALVCDLRWVEAKTQRLGSVIGAIADLEFVHTPTAGTLRWVLARNAPLLAPIDPPDALGATLASRVHHVPGLEMSISDPNPDKLTMPRASVYRVRPACVGRTPLVLRTSSRNPSSRSIAVTICDSAG